MPLYEYYCEHCDRVFDALGSIARSDEPATCPTCGKKAERIMPTTFASMSRRRGLKERVPFHHHAVRNEEPQKAIAPVRPRDSSGKKRVAASKKGK